jgi:hypothetical protein
MGRAHTDLQDREMHTVNYFQDIDRSTAAVWPDDASPCAAIVMKLLVLSK